MELLSGGSDWLDTATVTAQGLKLTFDTTSRGWGLLLGHQWGPDPATSGDFAMAMDTASRLSHSQLEIARIGEGVALQ